MKMGRWCSATFMEYIQEELACYTYSNDISTRMKQKIHFMNIAGGVALGVIVKNTTAIAMPYTTWCLTSAGKRIRYSLGSGFSTGRN